MFKLFTVIYYLFIIILFDDSPGEVIIAFDVVYNICCYVSGFLTWVSKLLNFLVDSCILHLLSIPTRINQVTLDLVKWRVTPPFFLYLSTNSKKLHPDKHEQKQRSWAVFKFLKNSYKSVAHRVLVDLDMKLSGRNKVIPNEIQRWESLRRNIQHHTLTIRVCPCSVNLDSSIIAFARLIDFGHQIKLLNVHGVVYFCGTDPCLLLSDFLKYRYAQTSGNLFLLDLLYFGDCQSRWVLLKKWNTSVWVRNPSPKPVMHKIWFLSCLVHIFHNIIILYSNKLSNTLLLPCTRENKLFWNQNLNKCLSNMTPGWKLNKVK